MSVEIPWPIQTEPPALAADAVHVWAFSLERPLSLGEPLLDQIELSRASRFYFEKDQRHFVAGRSILRTLLGHYLSLPPTAVAFVHGTHGKPELASGLSVNGRFLRFNLSHAGGVGLLGVTLNRQIGVDIEPVRALDDADDVAQRFFSTEEVKAYRAVPDEQKPMAFFNCWTRKEAFIKAVGEGLSYPLDQFGVSLVPDEPAELRWVANEETAVSHWQLAAVTPAPGFVGAIMAETPGWQLHTFQYA